MKNPFWMFRSWLGCLNFLVFQWLFIRLQEVGDLDTNKNWVHERWEFLMFPLPLTGWWTKYIYLYRGRAAGRNKLRYAFLKKRLLRCLLVGPKSAAQLNQEMKEDGFRTSQAIFRAIEDLVSDGKVRSTGCQDGKPCLYERVESTIDA